MNFVRGYPAPHYYAGANLCGSRAQSRTHLGYAEMEQRRRSQRRLKLTGKNDLLDVNADFMATYTMLDHPTLYPSPYVVLGLHGYTKHYYAGTERICAKIGGGFGLHISESRLELQDTANSLFSQSRDDIQHRELPQNDLNCVVSYGHVRDEELRAPLRDMPNHLYTDADIDLGWFHHAVERCEREYEGEDKVFFYHSDHLGSASWITNKTGNAIQHLQYLPFGTPFVDQHAPGAGYSERFTFTGKEQDSETGYGYFGARYYDSEALTGWLSVDPMSDKYPSMSPYNYCAWNPMKLVDPDGRDWYVPEGASAPVWDERVTADNVPCGSSYVGKTAHWFGQFESDMQFYCHGDEDGDVTYQDLTVTITPEGSSNSPSSLYGAMVHAGVCSTIERTSQSRANHIYDPIKGQYFGTF